MRLPRQSRRRYSDPVPVEDQRVEHSLFAVITADLDGTTVVQTKGDANNGIVPWP